MNNNSCVYKQRNCLFYAKTLTMIRELVRLTDENERFNFINHKDHIGETPLLYHCRKGNWEAADALLKFDYTDINEQDNVGSTVLHHLGAYKRDVNDSLVQKILQRDGLVLKLNINQQTAMHVAASAGNKMMITLLAKSNLFSVLHVDKCGLTAFDLAATEDVFNILLSCYKDGNCQSRSLTEWRQNLKTMRENYFEGPVEDMVKKEGIGLLPETDENEEIKDTIHSLVNFFQAGMEIIAPELCFDWHQSGSVCERTKVMLPDEYDIVFLIKSLAHCKVEKKGLSYAYLEKNGKIQDKLWDLFDKGDKLSVECLFRYFYSAVQFLLSIPELWEFFNLYRVDARDITGMKTTISALNLIWHGAYYPWLGISLDLVPAILTCNENYNEQMPIYVAKKIHHEQESIKHLLFQVSYNEKEHNLIKFLRKEKEVYKLCKIVRSPAFCKEMHDDKNCKILISDHITSYMLKNVVFRLSADKNNELAELDQDMTIKELLEDVTRVYDTLSKMLDEGHVPTYICEQKGYNIITQYWRKDSTPWDTHLKYAQQYCSEILRRLNYEQTTHKQHTKL